MEVEQVRIILFVLWILIPVGALAYHLGPGQEQLDLEEASQMLLAADVLAEDNDWATAQVAYERALELVPDEDGDLVRKIRLQRAKAQINNAQLPAAHSELKSLVADMTSDKAADKAVLEDAQSTLANSQFYMTWLMRLEGLSRDQWQPEIDAAQATYRMLAEKNDSDSDQFTTYREDLESTIKLARMDLGELQGLPLPSQ